jgi:hypothetical protein
MQFSPISRTYLVTYKAKLAFPITVPDIYLQQNKIPCNSNCPVTEGHAWRRQHTETPRRERGRFDCEAIHFHRIRRDRQPNCVTSGFDSCCSCTLLSLYTYTHTQCRTVIRYDVSKELATSIFCAGQSKQRSCLQATCSSASSF